MTLNEIFEKSATRMPMLPRVVQELISSLDKSDINIDDVVASVSKDPVISARVLRAANTARISGGRAINHIDEAVLRMGFENLRLLVISSGFSNIQAFSNDKDRKHFWLQGFICAHLSQWLAKHTPSLDSNTAYTCGLLHNIGELLIHVAAPQEMAQIDKLVANGMERSQVENMVLGVDLSLVGAELARRWKLPTDIVLAIANHQNPMACQPFQPYAAIVALANLLASEFESGASNEDIAMIIPEPLLAQLEISDSIRKDIESARFACSDLEGLVI